MLKLTYWSHDTDLLVTDKLKVCPSFHTCLNSGLVLHILDHAWYILEVLMEKKVSVFWCTFCMDACSPLGSSHMWDANRMKLRDNHYVHRPYWWPFGTIVGKTSQSSALRRTKRPFSISIPILDAPDRRRPAAVRPGWLQHPLVSVPALACTQGCLLPWSSKQRWSLQGKILTVVTPKEIPALIWPPNFLCRHFCPWGTPQSPCLQLLIHASSEPTGQETLRMTLQRSIDPSTSSASSCRTKILRVKGCNEHFAKRNRAQLSQSL